MRRKPRSSLRPFWFVGTAVLVVAIAAGYFAASWPGFDAKHVRVVGNAIVPTREIVAAAAIDRHRNIWLQSSGAMVRRIERIPYILNAYVHRRPPSRVTIVVSERSPFAIARSGAQSALVDVQLRVLTLGEKPRLPVFVLRSGLILAPGRFLDESAATSLRAALLALHAHGVEPEELADTDGDVTAILPGDVHVLLGDETSAPGATSLVEPILARFALLGRFVRILDLRSPTTPVVTERRMAPRAWKPARAVRSNP